MIELGKPCPTCPRGVTATHAAAAGDALAWLPLNLTMSFDVTPSHHHGGTGSEYHWVGARGVGLLGAAVSALCCAHRPPPRRRPRRTGRSGSAPQQHPSAIDQTKHVCNTQEVAADLLELMHSNGTWNTSYLPWWQSLPAPGDMVALDMLTDEEAAMLQLPKWEVGACCVT